MRRNSVWLVVMLVVAAAVGALFAWRPALKQRDVYEAVVDDFLGNKAWSGELYVSIHGQDPSMRLGGMPLSAAELRYENGPVPSVYDRKTHQPGAHLDLGDIRFEGHLWRGYSATVPVVLTYHGQDEHMDIGLKLVDGHWIVTNPAW